MSVALSTPALSNSCVFSGVAGRAARSTAVLVAPILKCEYVAGAIACLACSASSSFTAWLAAEPIAAIMRMITAIIAANTPRNTLRTVRFFFAYFLLQCGHLGPAVCACALQFGHSLTGAAKGPAAGCNG